MSYLDLFFNGLFLDSNIRYRFSCRSTQRKRRKLERRRGYK